MTAITEPATGPQVSLVFAKELKRLASQVEKCCRNDDGIQMLSSLAAIGPIVKMLSKAALMHVADTTEVGSETEPTPTDQPSVTGYL